MNTASPSSSSRPRFRPATSALLGLSVLLAVSAAGVVLAQAREGRAVPRAGGAQGGLGDGRVDVQLGALGAVPMKASHVPEETAARLGVIPSASWAGPVTPDELRRVPRKLTSEERSVLRQDIRSAGEEVYEAYRKKKP